MTVVWRTCTQHVRPWFCAVTSDAFPAKAGPALETRCVSGTGFSREEAGVSTLNFSVSL